GPPLLDQRDVDGELRPTLDEAPGAVEGIHQKEGAAWCGRLPACTLLLGDDRNSRCNPRELLEDQLLRFAVGGRDRALVGFALNPHPTLKVSHLHAAGAEGDAEQAFGEALHFACVHVRSPLLCLPIYAPPCTRPMYAPPCTRPMYASHVRIPLTHP